MVAFSPSSHVFETLQKRLAPRALEELLSRPFSETQKGKVCTGSEYSQIPSRCVTAMKNRMTRYKTTKKESRMIYARSSSTRTTLFCLCSRPRPSLTDRCTTPLFLQSKGLKIHTSYPSFSKLTYRAEMVGKCPTNLRCGPSRKPDSVLSRPGGFGRSDGVRTCR